MVTQRQVIVAGIGASAGGLESFQELFSVMPVDSGMAFVLIQHLNPEHNSLTAQLLTRYTSMPVCEAKDNMQIKPNHVYVLPPNKFLSIKNGFLYLKEIPKIQGIRKAIDMFFESLAHDKKEKAICIILSGTGNDGMEGSKVIKQNGGLVIAQDPETAVFSSMPQSLISAGIADYILPIDKIPEVLIKYVSSNFTDKKDYEFGLNEEEISTVNIILDYLKEKIKDDFFSYKKPTLIRRIQRRIEINNLKDIFAYCLFLKNNISEVKILHKDLTIKMTTFFRNPHSFETLIQNILTKTEDNNIDVAFRVWVPGCSTGEEPYSIAMLLMEQPYFHNKKIQIFATDIDEEALDFARKGFYSATIERQVSAERLERFFDKVDNKYHVKSHLRKSVFFSLHNVLMDVPFSKLNLVSCRNLFIYIESAIQKDILKVFHFSLKPSGYLFLGNSETIGREHQLFETISKRHSLFKRINSPGKETLKFDINNKLATRLLPILPIEPPTASLAKNLFERVQQQLAEEYIPPTVLINNAYEVTYLFGSLNRYLEIPRGIPNLNLMTMARGNLPVKLRKAIQTLSHSQEEFITSTAFIKNNHERIEIEFKVSSLKRTLNQDLFTVNFKELKNLRKQTRGTRRDDHADSSVIENLEHELNEIKLFLKDTIDDLERSNEDLNASNEEVSSVNEELQAASEEMEISKEELESLNEELTVVNSQLQEKLELQDKINDDLTNLLKSTNTATIFLDRDFRLQRFTPEAVELYNFRESDIGRPLGDITKGFIDPLFIEDAKQVLVKHSVIEREIKTEDHKWYLRRILTYTTSEKKITGLVVIFSNVTGLKNTQELLQKSEKKLEKTIEKIKASNEDLKNFAYICSHDLQEPARTISSFAKLLNERLNDLLDEEAKKYLNFIVEGSQRMQEMIRGALAYAKLTHHDDIREPIDVEKLIKEILENLDVAIKEGGAKVTYDPLPEIIGDPIKISTVFQNLISNALKFKNRKNVKIHIGAEPYESGYIFSIKDNGIGMDMKHKGRLFELFYRLNKEEYPGTGVGLALCKKIINNNRGKIWVESKLGKGSTFYFTIPQKNSV